VSILAAPTYALVPGESPGRRIARIVGLYAGCSLSARREELAALVGRGVCDESIVAWQTNCATVALGVLAAAGVQHRVLSTPTANGRAFSDLVQLGVDLGAWRDPATDGPPVMGAALWYALAGQNDDHVEFLVDPGGPVHGGGGRPNNAVTVATGPVALSCGRPLHRWLDPERLGLPVAEATAEDVEPHA
jgi:hypothetical protein